MEARGGGRGFRRPTRIEFTGTLRQNVGRADEARRYAHLCLQHSQRTKPFYLSYAYEALARAEKLAGHTDLVAKYRAEAMRLSEAVEDADERELLINDLKTL